MEVVAMLLESGANPNIRNKQGKTPLYNHLEYLDKIILLLKAGADPNITDNSEFPLLLWANKQSVKTVIIDAGAKYPPIDIIAQLVKRVSSSSDITNLTDILLKLIGNEPDRERRVELFKIMLVLYRTPTGQLFIGTHSQFKNVIRDKIKGLIDDPNFRHHAQYFKQQYEKLV